MSDKLYSPTIACAACAIHSPEMCPACERADEKREGIDKDVLRIQAELLKGLQQVIPKEVLEKYPTFHWCNEFDGLPVAKGCYEYDLCLCGGDGPYCGE